MDHWSLLGASSAGQIDVYCSSSKTWEKNKKYCADQCRVHSSSIPVSPESPAPPHHLSFRPGGMISGFSPAVDRLPKNKVPRVFRLFPRVVWFAGGGNPPRRGGAVVFLSRFCCVAKLESSMIWAFLFSNLHTDYCKSRTNATT